MSNNTTKIGDFKALWFFLLLFSLKISAQCPTIPTSPISICNAPGFTFNDLNSSATDLGNGVSWYDAPTGGNFQAPNSLVQEGTYYADDNSGSCGTRNPLTVSFSIPPTNANLSYVKCTNDSKTGQDYFNEIISPVTPTGLTATIYSDQDLTALLDLTQLLPNGGTNLYIIFSDGTCESQIEIGSVGIFPSPNDPLPPTPQQFCSDANPTFGNLITGTTISASWYLTSDATGSPIPLSQVLVSGIYYVRAEQSCRSNTVAVTVEIDDPVNAGVSATLDYCEGIDVPSADINLYDALGVADITGSWSGPFTTSNGYLGTINITGQTAGSYVMTYTVPAVNACPDASTTVIITIYENFTSGIENIPAEFCESDAPNNFDLFTLLDNEDPGGQWTEGNSGTGPLTASTLNLTLLTPGTYNFTYSQNIAPNPCPEESTTVQIEILANPNPGVAVITEFCENDLTPNPFDLFLALDGSQDNNTGVWTDNLNTTITNPIDISNFTIAGSPYTFTYTVSNGSCEDSESVTLLVLPAPESGTVSSDSPISFCLGEAPASYDLFDLIDGEDQTGSWFEGIDNTGITTSNFVDLSLLTPGNYSFTFDVDTVGTCDDSLVTVQVIINNIPDTGIANNPAPFCSNDSALSNTTFDLNDILIGEDTGGNWSDDDSSGVLTGNTIDLSALPVGIFNYTYSITDANNCSNNTTVTITILEAPESGTVSSDSPISFCLGEAPASYDLFDLIDGEDQTGSWFEGIDNTGITTTNLVDLSGLTPGNYSFTFDVDAIGTCDDVLVTVEVIINNLPNTGIANNPAPFCDNDPTLGNTAFDLNSILIGENTGGDWMDDDASGVLTGNTIDLSALPVGIFNYTYSLTANNCSSNTTVTITILEAPESGTVSPDSPISFCLSEVPSNYDLFNLIDGEDQNGSWFEGSDNTGTLITNPIDLSSLTPGNYNFTFDVDAVGTCDDVEVTVEVIINETSAPTLPASQSFCDNATVADLAASGDNIQWYDEATLGIALATTTVLVDGTTYYASQTDTNSNCESSTRAEVLVTIFLSPNSGNENALSAACNDTTIDLFTALDGTQDVTGIWADTDTTGGLIGSNLDTTGLAPDDYTFTYTVSGNAPCALSASTVVTITIVQPVNAGVGTDISLCSTDNSIDLFDQITGETADGDWSFGGVPISNTIDPSIDISGTYTYTVTSACGSESEDIQVTVQSAADAGGDATIAYCESDGIVDLTLLLTGSPNPLGTWSPALASGTNIFDPVLDGAGAYTYTVVAAAPCTTDAMATVTVSINTTPAPTASNNDIIICLADNANPTVADLNSFIIGTSIQWYEDSSSITPLDASDVLIDGEDYYATQIDATTSCPSSLRTQINVSIGDAPTPSLITDGNEFCINDNPTIETLTLNIVEFNASSNNVIWYDDLTNGIAYDASNLLDDGTTYYGVLIDPVTNCESSVRLEVTVDLSGCDNISIPDGFSPNGDGVNDTFTVNNIDFLYPNYKIEFYNRYGSLVYKTKAGQAEFSGKANQSGIINKGDLPVGVYYYIINFNDGVTKNKQGSFYLNR